MGVSLTIIEILWIGITLLQVSLCGLVVFGKHTYKKSVLAAFPVFSTYVFFATAFVAVAFPVHFYAHEEAALYFEWGRLVNLILLIVVGDKDGLRRIYGPKMSLPDWAWKKGKLLILLSCLTAALTVANDIRLVDLLGAETQVALCFLSRFLWLAVASLSLYARHLGIARLGRAGMIVLGIACYASGELFCSFLPNWQATPTLLSAMYLVTLLLFVAGFTLRRFKAPPPAHPDVIREVLDMHEQTMKALETLIGKTERDR